MTDGTGRARDALAEALAEAGGAEAPPAARARLRMLLLERLRHGARELDRTRSGYELPVSVAVAAREASLVAVAPVQAALRADPARANERAWLVVAALVAALVEAGDPLPDREPAMLAGVFEDDWLALAVPARGGDPEVAALAFDERVAPLDRLRATGFALPPHLLDDVRDMRPPVGSWHELRVAEVVARLGGNPADERSLEALEEAVVARLGGRDALARPHEDPAPERRVARRILQRLAGMGKWGGYHTAFDHLARGFEGNDRRLAQEVGERLLAAGLLEEKTSVGQRHVYLNPRRAQEIYRLIDEGEVPPGLELG